MFARQGFVTNSSSSSFIIWMRRKRLTSDLLEDWDWESLVTMGVALLNRWEKKPRKWCVSPRHAAKAFREWMKPVSEEEIDKRIHHIENRDPELMESYKLLNYDPTKSDEAAVRELKLLKERIQEGYQLYVYNCEDLSGLSKNKKFDERNNDAGDVAFLLQRYSGYWPEDDGWTFAEDSGGITRLQHSRFWYDELESVKNTIPSHRD